MALDGTLWDSPISAIIDYESDEYPFNLRVIEQVTARLRIYDAALRSSVHTLICRAAAAVRFNGRRCRLDAIGSIMQRR